MTGRLPIDVAHALERGLVGRRRRHVELEIAGRGDARRAELGIALGVGGRLREAEIEATEQRRDHAAHALPAAERALRQAAVDDDHRNSAVGARQNKVRPQIGFDEQRQSRLPMGEETLDEARRVERDELMKRAFRQALLGERRRGDGAGGHQHSEVLRAQSLDQRHHREHFADAGAVHPDQRTGRPCQTRLAATFGNAFGVLLAALQPPRQDLRRHRRSGSRRELIKTQRKRQTLRQTHSSLRSPTRHAAHSVGNRATVAFKDRRSSTKFPAAACDFASSALSAN